MAIILHSGMTDNEILLAIAKEYAETANWEQYEKNYGAGRPVMRASWVARDRGAYARKGLAIIAERQQGRIHAEPSISEGTQHA